MKHRVIQAGDLPDYILDRLDHAYGEINEILDKMEFPDAFAVAQAILTDYFIKLNPDDRVEIMRQTLRDLLNNVIISVKDREKNET